MFGDDPGCSSDVLAHFFPHNLPPRDTRIVLLKVAKDQVVVLKFVRANLARPDVSSIARHFGYMNDLLLHYIDLVAATIEECAIGRSNPLLDRRMRRVG